MVPDTRNSLNVSSSAKEYSMLCFHLVNDENDSSSVSFRGLGPPVEGQLTVLVYIDLVQGPSLVHYDSLTAFPSRRKPLPLRL